VAKGPVPKRDSERIRRNKPDIETDTIQVIGEVIVPELGLSDPHPIVADLYESLRDSGQARYYEPSDWEFARLTCHFLDQQVKASRPSGQILAVLHSMMTDLLISEGSRRRVRLEVEREQKKAQIYDIAEMFRESLAQ